MPEPLIPRPHSPSVRMMFFWIGIISTILYRIIIVLEHIEGPWVKISWYVGTIGFLAYFWHRFQVSEQRSKLISSSGLFEKIETLNINENDKASLRYVLGTLRSSKERWNYIMIFASSALAIIVGVYLDFLS